MSASRIPVVERIMGANQELASQNRQTLDAHGVCAVNVMASPGAGKTSLIIRTAEALKGRLSVGVIEGDVASTIDAEKVQAAGFPVVQINTGGGCIWCTAFRLSSKEGVPLRIYSVDLRQNGKRQLNLSDLKCEVVPFVKTTK